VSQWPAQKVNEQCLSRRLPAETARNSGRLWGHVTPANLRSWDLICSSTSLLSSFAESLSLFLPVCCFLVLSLCLALNLQSLVCLKCQKFTVHKFYFD
jgi:hypothetical protein